MENFVYSTNGQLALICPRHLLVVEPGISHHSSGQSLQSRNEAYHLCEMHVSVVKFNPCLTAAILYTPQPGFQPR